MGGIIIRVQTSTVHFTTVCVLTASTLLYFSDGSHYSFKHLLFRCSSCTTFWFFSNVFWTTLCYCKVKNWSLRDKIETWGKKYENNLFTYFKLEIFNVVRVLIEVGFCNWIKKCLNFLSLSWSLLLLTYKWNLKFYKRWWGIFCFVQLAKLAWL